MKQTNPLKIYPGNALRHFFKRKTFGVSAWVNELVSRLYIVSHSKNLRPQYDGKIMKEIVDDFLRYRARGYLITSADIKLISKTYNDRIIAEKKSNRCPLSFAEAILILTAEGH